ncbi:MAG: energy-coupling factor ABC transporter ATP-binding protein [Bacteroidetes bacterium]|nr:energy-coupling factor ABC transporter ATP-binding protein [Bacteroidota bacterium]
MDPIIKFENVSYSYSDNKKVLDEISFTIHSKEKIAIIGPNAAGKSTLVSLFNGIRKAEGKISINGQIISQKNSAAIRAMVGVVFQNPEEQLFCPTVYDDVAFGPLNMGLTDNEVSEQVRGALTMVGLTGSEEKYINELSYGEKKLVSLATVLSMSPEILVFDEPSANLDPYHRRLIINWMKENDEKTIVVTTHDLDLALETCQRVILLAKGRIVDIDLSEKILKNKDFLEAHNLELPLSLQTK